ncbi:MAG: DeoR/GlpR family DNA-binding transcription regulator [Bacteroidales bacterium]
MTHELRKKLILQMLDKNEAITIKEIVNKCKISEITARRDLISLEQRGIIKRTHGGAILTSGLPDLFGFDIKAIENREQKIEICKNAASFIEENDTIYMDCGTTVYFLARFITRYKNLRVITNSLPVVSELMPYPQIKLYLIGGELDNSRKALYGQMTENLIARYKADKAFIGAGGVSLEHGLSSVDEKEASITIKMAQAAKKVYLLCDSSKVENDSYFTYSSLSLVSYFITDKGLDRNFLELYKNKGLNMIVTLS